MQSLKSIRLPEVDNFFKQSFEQKKLIPLYRESRRCRIEARYRTISHDRAVDQPHEFLGCNDCLWPG